MSSIRSAPKSRRGGAAVELVVLSPLIVLLLIGVIDYGRVFYTSVTVSNAARAGAEYGQQDPSTTADTVMWKTIAQADGNEAGTLTLVPRLYCECGAAAHACTQCSTGITPEADIEVTATKVVSLYFPYPGLPSTITVSRKATFRSQ